MIKLTLENGCEQYAPNDAILNTNCGPKRADEVQVGECVPCAKISFVMVTATEVF